MVSFSLLICSTLFYRYSAVMQCLTFVLSRLEHSLWVSYLEDVWFLPKLPQEGRAAGPLILKTVGGSFLLRQDMDRP